jgi:hypothetical protein
MEKMENVNGNRLRDVFSYFIKNQTPNQLHMMRFVWLIKIHAFARDKAYQLLAQCRWFSPGTPASPTTKTGRHDIADILLKVALNTSNQIKSNECIFFVICKAGREPTPYWW